MKYAHLVTRQFSSPVMSWLANYPSSHRVRVRGLTRPGQMGCHWMPGDPLSPSPENALWENDWRPDGLYHPRRHIFYIVKTFGSSSRFGFSFSLLATAGMSPAGQKLLIFGILKCILCILVNYLLTGENTKYSKQKYAEKLILTVSLYFKLPENFDLL